jgi:AcrR family transcriptional regulator
MQYAKDEIRQRIIDVAREEFLDRGFEKASIRTITSKAKTAKSNLYNYFKDKDDLFGAVLEPTVTQIRNGLELAKQYNIPKETGDYTLSSQQLVISVISKFIAQHTADVKLLLFKAQGSSLEGFKYEVLDAFTDNMVAWTRSVRTKRDVSRLFVRTVCSFYLNMIEQLLLAGPPADMAKFMNEISVFVYHGWKSVLAGE